MTADCRHTALGWPDDHQPRYAVDTNPTVRAYCWRIVKEWHSGNRRGSRPEPIVKAEAFAAELNEQDARPWWWVTT